MVDGLFFCATLTGRTGSHTSFVQTGAEMPDTVAEAVKPHLDSSWEGHSRAVGASAKGPVMIVKWCTTDIVQYIEVFQMSACELWSQLHGNQSCTGKRPISKGWHGSLCKDIFKQFVSEKSTVDLKFSFQAFCLTGPWTKWLPLILKITRNNILNHWQMHVVK